MSVCSAWSVWVVVVDPDGLWPAVVLAGFHGVGSVDGLEHCGDHGPSAVEPWVRYCL